MTAEQAKKALAEEAFFKSLAIAAEKMRWRGLDSTGQALASKASLVSNANSLVVGPVSTYLNNPTDEGLKAAYKSFFESVAKLALEEAGKSVLQTTVFGNVGLVIEGGRLVIGSSQWAVEEMIDEGRRQEMEAAIFGRDDDIALGSINNLFAQEPFFASGPVTNRRITRDNIGMSVTSEQQLRELWNYYGAYLKGGPMITVQSKADTDAMLQEAWPHLLKFWAFKRLEGFMEAGHRTFSTEMLRVYDAAEKGTLRAPCDDAPDAAVSAKPLAGTFGPPVAVYGQSPPSYEDGSQKFSGSVDARSVSFTIERKPQSEGQLVLKHEYSGALPGNLKPGDVIELQCHSTAAASGKYPPNIGGGCLWLVEGAVTLLEPTPRGSFVGIGSDGLHAESRSVTRFKVGPGPGIITVTAARTGWAWGVFSHETLNPAKYVYTFTK